MLQQSSSISSSRAGFPCAGSQFRYSILQQRPHDANAAERASLATTAMKHVGLKRGGEHGIITLLCCENLFWGPASMTRDNAVPLFPVLMRLSESIKVSSVQRHSTTKIAVLHCYSTPSLHFRLKMKMLCTLHPSTVRFRGKNLPTNAVGPSTW